MATTGKPKWEKYFKNNEVETYVKANSSSSKNKNYVYDITGTKTNTRLEHGHEIKVLKSDNYYDSGVFQNKVLIEYDRGELGYLHIDCIDKVKNGKATIQLESSKMINLGSDIIVDSLNKETNVPCKIFKTKEELALSIINGLELKPSVPDYIAEQFTEFFAGDLVGNNRSIRWNAGISDKEKNSLGAYLGELLIGYMALAEETSAFSDPDIVKYPIEYFGVPTDPSFPGIDSFIQYKNRGQSGSGGKYLISSKAGSGAKASIWNNLMPLIVNYQSKGNQLPRNSCLAKLTDSFKKVPGAANNGKKVVYHYGVNYILKVAATVTDSYKLYTELKTGRLSEDSKSMLESAKQIQSSLTRTKFETASSSDVTRNLADKGKGMTAFFCRYIADELMGEEESLRIITDRLSGKKFYQANLDMGRWRRGEIKFSTTHVKDTTIKIIGSKSATHQLDASQGTVNYELKYT
jgi:hypothetical protein